MQAPEPLLCMYITPPSLPMAMLQALHHEPSPAASSGPAADEPEEGDKAPSATVPTENCWAR